MTATTGTLAGAGAPPRLVSLFRAELERARSRRSLPWLTLVAVVAVVSGGNVSPESFAKYVAASY